MPERCAVCQEDFAFSNTVHMLIHTQSDAGVLDLSVCKRCYEEDIATAFASHEENPTPD